MAGMNKSNNLKSKDMKKYIVLVCIGMLALFVGGVSLAKNQTNGIKCAYAGHDHLNANSRIVKVQKVGKDTVFGPVSLPEVIVNTKKKA